MSSARIVALIELSTARTPIGKAYRGAFNNTQSPTLMGHTIRHAVDRAGVDDAEIDDVVVGSVLTAGSAGGNIGRLALLAAGLPASVSGQTIDRQCSSGLMAIATAAKQIMVDGMDVTVAGGQENISEIQNDYLAWTARSTDPNVLSRAEHAYMPMLQTAEYVVRKYGISREAQDEYALSSQQRTVPQMSGSPSSALQTTGWPTSVLAIGDIAMREMLTGLLKW